MSGLSTSRFLYGFALVFALGVGDAPALAQDRPAESPAVATAATGDAGTVLAGSSLGPPPSFGDLFKPLPGDFRRMVAPENALVAGIGTLGAVIGHAWDDRVASSNWGAGPCTAH